ncbi:MFS transporter [Actinomadura barringtoniae]|uniref:MFS transporter n=1 Tax=Actinomadura barringtoniae TaxID=1427535 RepID=A0A939PA43_9ACTN|nr:MFS transporter [Actinomadura barringtoniae]MBO2448337.1 MFS transporter [Actinomadura barringtoniae]
MTSTGVRAWAALLVLCGAIFLEGIDIAMLNVALPAIRTDLGLSTAMLSGVVSAYVLGYGGFMLVGGRAADLFGRRRMFLLWLVVFLVFSGLGGLATEGWMLLAARFVTGVAAAFLAPAGLSLVTAAFPEGPARTRALSIYAATGAGGFTLGLVAGGLLTPLGWRWVFFAPVAMSALLLIAAVPLVKEVGVTERGRLDLPGGLLVTGAMSALVYGVVRLEHPSASPALTAAVFAAGLLMLAAFVAVERRVKEPLVRLGVLRSAPLLRANVGALLFMGAFGGFQFLLTLYLQELRGWSALQTGLTMLVAGVDVILAPVLTPRLVTRYGVPRVILAAMFLAAACYAIFLRASMDWTYAAMAPGLFLLGLAFTLAYGPLTMAATENARPSEQGLAGGLFYTSIQFGMALGISLVTAVNVAALSTDPLKAIHIAMLVPLGAALLGATITATGLRRAARPSASDTLASDAAAANAAPANAAPANAAPADAAPANAGAADAGAADAGEAYAATR